MINSVRDWLKQALIISVTIITAEQVWAPPAIALTPPPPSDLAPVSLPLQPSAWDHCFGLSGCYQQALATPDDLPADLVSQMVQDAAQQAGVPVDHIRVVEVRQVTWANGCMWRSAPDLICTMALVDGWVVLLASDTQSWLYSLVGSGFAPIGTVDMAVLPPGVAQGNPILPDVIADGRFVFRDVPTDRWFDPPMTPGFRYQMLSDSRFTQLLNFPVGIDGDGLFTVSVGDRVLGQFQSNQSIDFVSLFGAGVSEFTITGIDPLVDATDPVAFPVRLAFDTETADFSMEAIAPTSAAVPEPSSVMGLLVAGTAAYQARRRRQSTTKAK